MIAIVVVLLIFLSLFVFALVSFISKHSSVAVLRLLPVGRKPSILFGNALHLRGEADVVLQLVFGWMQRHNHEGILCLWFSPTYPMVLIYKPELAELLLNSSKHTTKSVDYDLLHPWLGTGTLTKGEKWRSRRKLITPTFHFSILNDFIQVCEEQTAILISHLQEKVNKGAFDIMPYIALLTLDIICVTSMGPSANAQEKSNSPYVQAVVKLSELLEMRSRSPWFWPDAIFNLCPPGREFNNCLKILHGFTDKVIDEQIAERAAKKLSNRGKKNEDDDQSELTSKRRLAFLDALLEAYENGEISREGVREEVDTFMFEGHDTTSAGITWALYLLGRHPVIQQRVYEEVESFFERRSNVLTVDDLKEFRFLECVLKESQRLFPSVPFFSRSTSEDCQLGGYFIPKGTTIGVSTFALHRNPEVWPAPLVFDPDRFLPGNIQGRHPFAFLPFSAGPRNCIGQRLAFLEEKLVLAHVLRHFEIQSTQAVDDIHLCVKFVLRSKEGVFVTLVHRQKGKVA
ncbi:unnamed protein product [Porites evermanni]|uniref:Cytochrome P450 n=1 Tax=Porites evermanni TaxID=104178 RepID=A0ABN8LZQ1_9CNID|nr:unnamed protein product [Porites evermanni]